MLFRSPSTSSKTRAYRDAINDKNLANTAGNLKGLESNEAELTLIRKTNNHA